jgi:DNA/RNA endonuclease YhcR with UshA esterase domain
MKTFAVLLALAALPASAETIAQARALPAGTAVTLEGTVSVPPGLLSSATLEDQGFAIQDATDGIYVSIDATVRLELNRRVRVSGHVEDVSGLRALRVDDAAGVTLLPGARRVAPEPIATGDFGEEFEGRLVTITGVLTQPVFHDHPYGDELHLDDGTGDAKVFVHLSTGVDVDGIPWIRPGERITVIGLGSQFLETHEIAPRFRGDLRRAP